LACPATRKGAQEMLRKAASKVAWVGRTASMVFGLALVVGAVTAAFGTDGDHFTIQVASIFDTNRMATIELFTEKFGPSVCGAEAHVIYTFAPARPSAYEEFTNEAVL
jgi:hypothetical protein